MKHLLKITLAIIISYALMAFVGWDWNITSWEYYQRLGMVVISLIVWLLINLVETADFTLNDEKTRNDEIIESYKENKKRC